MAGICGDPGGNSYHRNFEMIVRRTCLPKRWCYNHSSYIEFMSGFQVSKMPPGSNARLWPSACGWPMIADGVNPCDFST